MNGRLQSLEVERLGQQGEGICRTTEGTIFVPYAVPGDLLSAEIADDRGKIVQILRAGPDRVSAICRYFGDCGGCAVQTLALPAYRKWKLETVKFALEKAGISTPISAFIDAHGEGRRRATFHVRYDRAETGTINAAVGFMRAREHTIVDIESCPVLSPGLNGVLDVAHSFAKSLTSLAKPFDIVVTATETGLDIDLRGTGSLNSQLTQSLVNRAGLLDVARLSNHGVVIIERRTPLLRMSGTAIAPPPGAFLQATQCGEEALAKIACETVGNARRVADLFAGIGTFSLRLAKNAEILAVESDQPALSSLERAANNATGLRPVCCERRDLFKRPLLGPELEKFDAVVFDPPRAGAEAQAKCLASSSVPLVLAVSCNAQTFARDAMILIDGGYAVDRIVAIDQFRYSQHVEIVGIFRKSGKSGRPRRKLLG